jgi:hypothetical protein
VREVREETGLEVEPLELVELLDRIHREAGRVRYHYVIADYLCRVTGGELRAASDADAVRWVERAEWNSHSALVLDPITVRVIEKGWQRAQSCLERAELSASTSQSVAPCDGQVDLLVSLRCFGDSRGIGFYFRPVSYLNAWTYLNEDSPASRAVPSKSQAIACTILPRVRRTVR